MRDQLTPLVKFRGPRDSTTDGASSTALDDDYEWTTVEHDLPPPVKGIDEPDRAKQCGVRCSDRQFVRSVCLNSVDADGIMCE